MQPPAPRYSLKAVCLLAACLLVLHLFRSAHTLPLRRAHALLVLVTEGPVAQQTCHTHGILVN